MEVREVDPKPNPCYTMGFILLLMILILLVPSPFILPEKLLNLLYTNEEIKQDKPNKPKTNNIENLLDDELIDEKKSIDEDEALRDSEEILRSINEN